MNYRHTLSVGLNKLLETPANLGSQLVALPPVASRLATFYEKAKRDHAARIATLQAEDLAIIDGLRRTGVHVTSLAAMGLAGSDGVLAEADKIVAKHMPLERSFQCDAPDLLAHDAILRWGVTERLIDIAENYLGVPVGYDGINIFMTKADGRESGARRWHRDAEDRRMLKIALYVHDVDLGGGPLQVLKRRLPAHDRTVGGKFPILTQKALEAALGDFDAERDVATCTGARGTLIFADTASFYHRGMPAVTRDRCAIYFNYMHRVPLRPFRCERMPLARAHIRRIAAPLSARQRACMLWREDLPFVGRLIPPAPIWK